MEYLNQVGVLAGLAVLLVHQVLKLKLVPLAFANRYPVLTNILLSIVTAAVVVWQNNVATPAVWTDWVHLVATISLVAAFAYNMTIKHWAELRELEGVPDKK